jgi:hypothetical protein
VKWLGIIRRRPPPKPQPAPTLTTMFPPAVERPSDRDVRLVRDVATHVTSKVVPIVELHGRTMENALQANVMAVEVALRLGLEAAQRTALTAVAQGAPLDLALEKLDDAIAILVGGLNDHRCDLAATIEAVHAGIAGGQVRQ